MKCRHCQRCKAVRRRGLCWKCYYTTAVRDLYPITSKFARRGVKDTYAGRPQPEPTATLSGTPERVAVLAARAMAGVALFHPADARRQ